MPKKTALRSSTRRTDEGPDEQAQAVIAQLKKRGTKKVRDGMARFAIPSDKAFGVSVGALRDYGKELGRSHELAAALWESGWYEARMLAAFVDEPERITPTQMDRWCQDFDNWAICDAICFHLFDRTPHAWKKVSQWSSLQGEFQKRSGFALLWALSVHDKQAADERFLTGLKMIEREAADDRNFVKKAANMALRAIGKRNAALHAAAVQVAQRLGESKDPAARWNGKDALRELNSASVKSRLKRR